jgi:hypothetical protein
MQTHASGPLTGWQCYRIAGIGNYRAWRRQSFLCAALSRSSIDKFYVPVLPNRQRGCARLHQTRIPQHSGSSGFNCRRDSAVM